MSDSIQGGVSIAADFPCPHCEARIEATAYFSAVNIPTRSECPSCRRGVWVMLTGIDADTGQASYKIGTPIGESTPGEITATDGKAVAIECGSPADFQPGTFRAWLIDQKPETQDRVLGKDRADKFRDGEPIDLLAFNAPGQIEARVPCPTCNGAGYLLKPGSPTPAAQGPDPRLRTYRLTDDLGIKRQGVSLSARSASILLSKMCDGTACPFSLSERVEEEDGSIVVKLYWDEPEQADKGLTIGSTIVPEVK
jgi:hypothetical protein